MWSLQQLLLLLSLFYLAYAQTEICGNAGSFDTSSLLRFAALLHVVTCQ